MLKGQQQLRQQQQQLGVVHGHDGAEEAEEEEREREGAATAAVDQEHEAQQVAMAIRTLERMGRWGPAQELREAYLMRVKRRSGGGGSRRCPGGEEWAGVWNVKWV